MINNKLLKEIMEAHGDKDIIKKLIDNLHVSRLSATQIINGERKLFPSERVALSHMLLWYRVDGSTIKAIMEGAEV